MEKSHRSSLLAMAASLRCFPSSFADVDDDGQEEEQVVFKGLSDSQSAAGDAEQISIFKSKPADLAMVDEDMMLSTEPLPEGIAVTPVFSWVYFRLCSELDLKSVSCKLRNAEYNPRKGLHRMHLRLLKPATDATVWSKGTVHCCVKGDGNGQAAARRITRLVQKCGYPDATCKSFRLMKQKVKADLFFPVIKDSRSL